MFGDRVRYLRECKELKVKEVAEYLNISGATLTNYELNRREPSIDMIKRIANYYKVSVDYLMENDNVKKQVTTKHIPLKDELVNLLKNRKIINDECDLDQEYLKFLEYSISIIPNRIQTKTP